MLFWPRGAVVLCMVLGLSAVHGPAFAGMFDDEEARARVEALRKELSQSSAAIEVLRRNQLDFANQLEAMRADQAKIRGQLEVLAYELEATQKRQKDFYVDLDNRVRKLEQPAPTATVNAAQDEAAEARDYEAAVASLKALKYKIAADQFGAFIATYPSSTFTASAYYWGGYANAQNKNHAKAVELFGKFAATWPADERVPGALESQVASYDALKDSKSAEATLVILASKYASSDAGKRAQQRLKKK
ncbi:MAG: tol-pal system protein YbgF [Rhodocyclaceae bacterium]|nr:tol-pal system protein YbgF [Rhodocyclaceae bacterium]